MIVHKFKDEGHDGGAWIHFTKTGERPRTLCGKDAWRCGNLAYDGVSKSGFRFDSMVNCKECLRLMVD